MLGFIRVAQEFGNAGFLKGGRSERGVVNTKGPAPFRVGLKRSYV